MAKKSPPDWLVPGYPPLSGEVGEAAVRGKTVYYPEVIRGQKDYPVPQQGMGLISFMLFREPKKLQSGAPLYGFAKMRGNYSDVDMCKSKASDIIRSQDSRSKIKVVEVGSWFPITEEERGIVEETVDVKEEETDKDKLREQAMKEEKAKAQRIMKELKDREKEITESRDYNEDPESLDYYTMKMVAWQRLHEAIEIEKNKIKSLEEKWVVTRKLLSELDEKNPTYVEAYVKNLNKERRKAGIPDYVPSEKELELYASTNPNKK